MDTVSSRWTILCPVTAIRTSLAVTPTAPNNPSFQRSKVDVLVFLRDSQVRKHLKNVCRFLTFTFHDFRMGLY